MFLHCSSSMVGSTNQCAPSHTLLTVTAVRNLMPQFVSYPIFVLQDFYMQYKFVPKFVNHFLSTRLKTIIPKGLEVFPSEGSLGGSPSRASQLSSTDRRSKARKGKRP
jgi:hypothetical protein